VIEALNLLGTKLAGPLSFFSAKTIVISEELAKDGIMLRRVISAWSYEQMRNNTNVLISSSDASDFIKARVKDPVIDLLRQEDLILEQANHNAYYTAVQFLDLIITMKTGGQSGVAMYGSVAKEENAEKNEEGGNGNDVKKESAEEKEESNYDVKLKPLSNEIPVKADNKTQLAGLAIFSEGKMAGTLTAEEAQTYAMMTKSKTRKIMTLPDPLDADGSIVVSVMPNGKSKIRGYFLPLRRT
jgi:hypothetical protein